LLGWLVMAVMMAGGTCCGMAGQGPTMVGAGVGLGLLAVVVLAAVTVALVWALRTSVRG